jgi:hypothetical protein
MRSHQSIVLLIIIIISTNMLSAKFKPATSCVRKRQMSGPAAGQLRLGFAVASTVIYPLIRIVSLFYRLDLTYTSVESASISSQYFRFQLHGASPLTVLCR